jgi:hypothetical protein
MPRTVERLRRDPRAKKALPTKEMRKNKGNPDRATNRVSKSGTKNSLETTTSMQVAQLRALWDIGMPVHQIMDALKWSKQKIYKIAKAYDFPPRSLPRASANEPSEEDIQKFKKLWEADCKIVDIEEYMDWNKKRIYQVKTQLGLPDRTQGRKGKQPLPQDILISEEEERETTVNAILHDPKHPIVKQYETQVVDRNVKALAEEEFDRQLAVTMELEKLAWSTIDVMGRTSGEIEGYSNEDSLLKKTMVLKGATELIRESMKSRRSLLCLEAIAKEEQVDSLFSIDYIAAAKAGGLDATPTKAKEDIQDVEDWEFSE